MTFQVEISEKADHDLRNIFLYIAIDLFSPEVAEKQIHRLRKGMLSLLYIPDLEEHIVRIVRVLYSGRDISEPLQKL